MRVDISWDALCQSYMEEGEVKSSYHFLLYCLRLRTMYIGSHTIGEPSELAGIHINRLKNFCGDPLLGVYE